MVIHKSIQDPMKALQVTQPRIFQQVEVPTPYLDSGQAERILVRTCWVSMCGSDIPFFTGSKRYRTYPLPVGAPIHECVGQVVESTSKNFHPGDTVIALPDGNQGLAEYFVTQPARAICLPEQISGRDASCLIQPLSTVLNAVDRLGDVAGKSVAVIGLGSIGLLFCWLFKKRGATHILGIDPIVERCQAAEKFGASETIPARSLEVVHSSRQIPGVWAAPDICIEAVGHQMETLNDCLELVKKQGTVLAFGVPDQPVYAIEYETFFRKNAQLIAAVTPEWRTYLTKALEIFIQEQEQLEGLVTHRFPIWSAQQAFTLYENHAQGVLKVILDAADWQKNAE